MKLILSCSFTLFRVCCAYCIILYAVQSAVGTTETLLPIAVIKDRKPKIINNSNSKEQRGEKKREGKNLKVKRVTFLMLKYFTINVLQLYTLILLQMD